VDPTEKNKQGKIRDKNDADENNEAIFQENRGKNERGKTKKIQKIIKA